MKVILKSLLEFPMEFTFIDYCSRAVTDLAFDAESKRVIYHVFNNNFVKVKDFVEYLINEKRFNITILDVDGVEEYLNCIKVTGKEKEDKFSLLMLYNQIINREFYDNNKRCIVSSKDTIECLKKINFKLPSVDYDYICKFFDL